MSESQPLLSALLTLITSSTHTLQAELASAGLPEPWLDNPALHPWDEHTPPIKYWDARRTLLSALAMMTALVQNPHENVLNRGMGYHHPAALNFTVRACIPDILASEDVDERIGLHVDEIAKRAGTHPAKTATVLRFLCIHHIFTETSPLVFANNKLSNVLKNEDSVSGAPVFWGEIGFRSATYLSRSLRDPATAHSFEVTDAPFGRAFKEGFEDAEIIDGEVEKEQAVVSDEAPSAPLLPSTAFTFLAHPRHATYRASFVRGMHALDAMHGREGLFTHDSSCPGPDTVNGQQHIRARGGGTHSSGETNGHNADRKHRELAHTENSTSPPNTRHAYSGLDWTQWDVEGSVYVDVGGSTGHLAESLLPSLKHAKFVCQDRPEVCEQGVHYFTQKNPEALHSGRVVFQANDFFQGQPVKGAPVYILQNILHNWPEKEGLLILDHVASAMSSTSSMLVIEVMISAPIAQASLGSSPSVKAIEGNSLRKRADNRAPALGAAPNEDPALTKAPADDDRAPWPLLTDYGVVNGYAHHQAMEMINLFNSLDRTLPQYVAMFEKAGLELVKVHRVRKVVSVLQVRKIERMS